MKKYRFALLIAATITALNLTFASALAANQPEPSPSAQAVLNAAIKDEDAGFLLLAVDGKVCVYQSGVLLLRTDIDVSLLPAADRRDLAAGIRAGTAHELAGYLEDFGA